MMGQEEEVLPDDLKKILLKVKDSDLKSITVKVEDKSPSKGNNGYIVLTLGNTPGSRTYSLDAPTREEKAVKIGHLLSKNPNFTFIQGNAGPDFEEPPSGEIIFTIAPKGRSLKDTHALVVDALKQMGTALDTSTGAADILDKYHRRPGTGGVRR